MTWDEKYYETLSPMGVPVSKPPGDGTETTYITIQEAQGTFEAYAGNRPRRVSHMVQVQIHTKLEDGSHRELFRRAVRMMQDAGIKVVSYGPDAFDTETRYNYIAATTEWSERMEEYTNV